jgi:hypothetical protein
VLRRPPALPPPITCHTFTVKSRRRAQHRAAQRRYRRRERTGELMVTLALDPTEVAKLVMLRYLRDCEIEDRRAIAAAVKALIAGIRVE